MKLKPLHVFLFLSSLFFGGCSEKSGKQEASLIDGKNLQNILQYLLLILLKAENHFLPGKKKQLII